LKEVRVPFNLYSTTVTRAALSFAALANLENWSPAVIPTDTELADLSTACNKLWELDIHRLHPGVEYGINLQAGKKPYEEGDAAPEPLFAFVDEQVLRRPTFAAFISLLDNYERATGITEVVTAEEKLENSTFLELCMVRAASSSCAITPNTQL
jgi:hypothetical protein